MLPGNIFQNKYGSFKLPPDHVRPVTECIRAGKVHQDQVIEFCVKQLQQRRGAVVSAGSYIGDFLPAFSRACQSKVYAFEPVLENYSYAKENIKLNDLQNVILQNAGLSDHFGSVSIKTTENDIKLGGASSIQEFGNETAILVKLDDVLDPFERIALIQLDVEGHEKEALAGASRTLSRWQPVIVVEEWKGGEKLVLPNYTKGKKIQGDRVWMPKKKSSK